LKFLGDTNKKKNINTNNKDYIKFFYLEIDYEDEWEINKIWYTNKHEMLINKNI